MGGQYNLFGKEERNVQSEKFAQLLNMVLYNIYKKCASFYLTKIFHAQALFSRRKISQKHLKR